MTVLSQTEAADHLARAKAEIGRLKERFPQRPKDEKVRMGQLERLVPKLKRLAKPLAVTRLAPDVDQPDTLTEQEQKLLASLVPETKK